MNVDSYLCFDSNKKFIYLLKKMLAVSEGIDMIEWWVDWQCLCTCGCASDWFLAGIFVALRSYGAPFSVAASLSATLARPRSWAIQM
jgi:hypothetical protein